MGNSPLISVIVPVYNVEKYILRCVESIQRQTYENVEIILIDDGSTDSSGLLCDKYASKDKRISVVHQANAGLSAARNAGLKIAKGEYVGFVDGDDYIHPQMYEVLLSALLGTDYTFSMVLGRIVPDVSELFHFTPPNGLKRELHKEELTEALFNHRSINNLQEYQLQAVWNKLYRRTIIGQMLFKDMSTEDTEWNNRMYQRTTKAVLIESEMYCWVMRSTSITHQKVNENYIDRANSYCLCLNEIPATDMLGRACCLEKLYKTMVNVRYWAWKTEYKPLAIKTVERLKKQTINEFLHNRRISLKMKSILLLFLYVPATYRFFMWLCEKRAAHN